MDYLRLKARLEAQLEAKRAERDDEIRRRHREDGLSLAELGRIYSITRERVRQIVLSGSKQ